MTSGEDFSQRIKNWLDGLATDLKVDEHDFEDLERYLLEEFDYADSMSDTSPGEAYGKILEIANLTSKAAVKEPLLVGLLMKYLQRFVNVMNKVQKAMGAASFSIAVSFPFDIDLILNF